MSIFLNKNKTGKVFLQEKTISQVYYQQKKVFPENVVEDIDYFWFDNQGLSPDVVLNIANFDSLSIKMEYSTDKITWTEFFGHETFVGETVNDVNEDDTDIMPAGIMRAPELAKNTYVKIYLRGVNNATLSKSNLRATFQFSQMATAGTLMLKIGGNILTLLDKDASKFEDKRLPDYCFTNLFSNNSGIYDASSLELTPKLSSMGLYQGMFYNCTEMITSPQKIYLTDMSEDCCRTMFYKCSSLVNIPDTWCSNVTELGYYVYTSSISKSWKLAENCFMSCFRETAIKQLPKLPATKLANLCYAYMFAGCKGLTTQTGWYLPCESFNTSQTSGCYNYMFIDCTNLVKMATRQSNISSDYNFNWLKNITTNGILYMKRGSTQTEFESSVKPANWTVSKVL